LVSASATSAANPSPGTQVTQAVSCTGGKILVGGGAHVTTTGGGNDAKVALFASYPTAAGANGTWSATAIVTGNISVLGTVIITVYAVCA